MVPDNATCSDSLSTNLLVCLSARFFGGFHGLNHFLFFSTVPLAVIAGFLPHLYFLVRHTSAMHDL